MSFTNNIFIIWLFFILLAIIGIQILLSTRKNIVFGAIIPIIFLIFAGYNLYIDLFIYNPRPTMAQAIYMTVGIIGFAISLGILIISRIVKRNNSL